MYEAEGIKGRMVEEEESTEEVEEGRKRKEFRHEPPK